MVSLVLSSDSPLRIILITIYFLILMICLLVIFYLIRSHKIEVNNDNIVKTYTDLKVFLDWQTSAKIRLKVISIVIVNNVTAFFMKY